MIRAEKYKIDGNHIQVKLPFFFKASLFFYPLNRDKSFYLTGIDFKLVSFSYIWIKCFFNKIFFRFKKKILVNYKLLAINKLIPKATVNFKSKEYSETEMNISNDIVTRIIDKINIFEQDKIYLECHITLMSMAKNIETNSTYLSKVINTIKHKSFTNYINDLRIEHAVEQLKINKNIADIPF